MDVLSGIENDLLKYEAIIVRTHQLDCDGHLESVEADNLRELSDPLWYRLSKDEQALVKGLSADLYMIQQDEILQQGEFDTATDEELRQYAQEAYSSANWNRLLAVLRTGRTGLAALPVASLRAASYEALGLHRAATEFTRYAADLCVRSLIPDTGTKPLATVSPS